MRRICSVLALVNSITGIVLLGGCSIFRTLTGTELDAEQFAKAREAKIMEVRLRGAVNLAERLQKSNPVMEGDLSLQISERFLNTLAGWYRGRSGRLDQSTIYVVDSVEVTLKNGAADATLLLRASQEKYGVDVMLEMDCLLSFEKGKQDLALTLEPYNITPRVGSTGFLVGTRTIIENVVKMQVGRLSEDFPPLRIPLDFSDNMAIDNAEFIVRDKINLDISIPRRIIDYNYSIRDVLVLREGVFVVLDLQKVGVR